MVIALGKEAIVAAVEFANLKEITSAEQVEDIFYRRPFPRGHWNTLEYIPQEEAVAAFQNDQRELRGWLDQIAEPGRLKRKARERVEALFGESVGLLFHWKFVGGRAVPKFVPSLTGVQACCAFALVALSAESKLADKLRICELPECDNYFFNPGRGGWRQRYCPPYHAGTARQRVWRGKGGAG